ncbi:MAG: hypothetical protein DRP47_07555 [Candidatus Zixiibacteriota bacterium]|nr:MAG: hypothetical protein DRP47_07555 [candidate division Zixibacteria bacterium]
MKYTLIDLSDSLFNGDKGSHLDCITCKFVLIDAPDEVAMVFGTIEEFPYHATLVDRFCKQRQLACEWIKRPDLVELFEPDYDILGGGYMDFRPVERFITFSGASTAYGSFPQLELSAVLDNSPVFASYRTIVSK